MVQSITDSYLRVYNPKKEAIDISEDLSRLLGYKEETPKLQKNLANVMFINILTYAFNFDDSRTLLKRLSNQGCRLSCCHTIMR
jgi:hypothetical protein